MKLRNVCPIEHEMLSASFLSGPLKTPRDQLVPSSYLTVRYNYGLQLAEYADYFRYTNTDCDETQTKVIGLSARDCLPGLCPYSDPFSGWRCPDEGTEAFGIKFR